MKLQLKRSNVLDGGFAKVPTTAQLEYGELAVNYNLDDPCIFIKDSGNNIIRISGKGMPVFSDTNIQPGTLDDRYPLKSGDTMTGQLILFGDPVDNLGAASKQYVDTEIANIDLPSETEMSATPPTNPTNGAFWWDTNDGRLYVYYTDLDSSQWVPATPESGAEVAADGGIQGTGDGLAVLVDPNGGLQTVTAGVGVLADPNGGIETSSTGTALKVNTNGGLETTSSGAGVKVKVGGGINVASDGLQISNDWSNIAEVP